LHDNDSGTSRSDTGMPAAPKLRWIFLTYYAVMFMIGVVMELKTSYEALGLLDLGRAGVWWLMMTNLFFFAAPWIHDSWIAPVIVILVLGAIMVACFRLKGWIRAIAVVALLLCLNAYSLYALMLTGG
jgi:hypothetical protein